MDREDLLYRQFIENFKYEPTQAQDRLFHDIAAFILSSDSDIFLLNGYAGTGKTTVLSTVIEVLAQNQYQSVLLAPTGRAAKTLSRYANRPASTIHLHIYRQKNISDQGLGEFTLSYNKNKNTLYVIDEISLISIDNGENKAHFGTGNLLEDLVSYVRSGDNNKMIMLGDSAQLPPIGMLVSPALSKEYMSFIGGVTYAQLRDVVRQSEDSAILKNATNIRYLIEKEDFQPVSKSQLHIDMSLGNEIERITGADLIDCISDAYAKYGEDECMILCRSNKKANRYNMGIRSMVQYKEEELLKGDQLMVVKNAYNCLDKEAKIDYIANGDIAKLVKVKNFTQRYELNFADAILDFSDYDIQIKTKICLNTLHSESAALTKEEQTALFQGVWQDYSHLGAKSKIYKAVKEDPFFNALQIKYAQAITCHKSQGGQWDCVFIDNPFWQDSLALDDLKWLYTAMTRAVKKLYLVNFDDAFFE